MHFFCIYYMKSLISWSSKHVLCLPLLFWKSLPLKNLLLVESDLPLAQLWLFFKETPKFERIHIVHMAFAHPGENYSSHNLKNYHSKKSKDFRKQHTPIVISNLDIFLKITSHHVSRNCYHSRFSRVIFYVPNAQDLPTQSGCDKEINPSLKSGPTMSVIYSHMRTHTCC